MTMIGYLYYFCIKEKLTNDLMTGINIFIKKMATFIKMAEDTLKNTSFSSLQTNCFQFLKEVIEGTR